VHDDRPTFVMVLPACRGRAIGDNAIRRAEAIADWFSPVIISDSFPDHIPKAVRTIKFTPPRFNYLRRFCHVPNELGFAVAAGGVLVNLASRERVAFVLCHGYTLAWIAGRWVRRRTKTPFGMFMHGHIFERPKGMYDSRVTAFYRTIAPTCYRESNLVFALSPAQADLAVLAGADTANVVVAPNGLEGMDIGLVSAASERGMSSFTPGTPCRLLYVGRLAIEKGVEVLLHACCELVERGVAFSLRVVGAGGLERDLRTLSRRLDLGHCVDFVGSVSRRELGDFYLQSDILCVPSLTEALGNVVLEGMIAGCVVVGSNTGGIPSMVLDGETGMLVPPGDSRALADALCRAISRPDWLRTASRAAISKVTSEFSWPSIGITIKNAVYGLQ